MAEALRRVAGVLLAGGKSRRMGRDKALLPFGQERWIDRMIQTLRKVPCDEIFVSGDRPELRALGRLIPDRERDLGPLGGLSSILPAQGFTHLLVVPVDMPLLSPELLRHLVSAIQSENAVVFEDHPLPWVGRLSERLIHTIETLVAPEQPPRQRSFRELNARLNAVEIQAPSGASALLRNFNTPEDLRELTA